MSQTDTNSKDNKAYVNERKITVYPSDFIKGIKKLWWTCILLAVLAGGGMFFNSYRSYTPKYTVSATFTVSTQNSSASIGGISVYSFYYDSTTAAQLASTFPYLLNSNLLSDMICEDMGITSIPVKMNASAVAGSNMFTLSVTGRDPQLTYDILQSVIKNYPSVAKYVVGNIKLTMITTPTVPTKPSNSSGYVTDGIKGTAIGFAAGLALIVIYALSRKTVRTKEDVRNELNCEYIGTIPQVRFKKHKVQTDCSVLFTNDKAGAGFLESVRVLRNTFTHALGGKDKIIMVTSTAPGEGKTTVLTNLAISLADYDKKVLLIDGDLRNPSVAKLLGLNLDELNWHTETEKYKITDLGEYNISFMSIDNSDLKKQRFINSGDIKSIFDSVRNSYDYIFVDAPPCGLVSDALYIAQEADAAFYVIYQDAVRIGKIRSGLDGLMSTNVKIIGCVINGAGSGIAGYGHSYGYGSYGYGHYGYGHYGYGGKYLKDSAYGNPEVPDYMEDTESKTETESAPAEKTDGAKHNEKEKRSLKKSRRKKDVGDEKI